MGCMLQCGIASKRQKSRCRCLMKAIADNPRDEHLVSAIEAHREVFFRAVGQSSR